MTRFPSPWRLELAGGYSEEMDWFFQMVPIPGTTVSVTLGLLICLIAVLLVFIGFVGLVLFAGSQRPNRSR
jgi:hypothetical protein